MSIAAVTPDIPTCQEGLSDADLVEKIRVGDMEAFQIFYLRYYDSILQFLCYKMGDTEIAYDTTQETFLRIWQHRERLEPSKSIKAFMYRTARNLATDYWRKHRSEAVYEEAQGKRQSEVSVSYPDNDRELREHIHAAIRALPESLQQVIILSRFQNLSYKDIANTLNISMDAVEKRMIRAFSMLRVTLRHLLGMLIMITHSILTVFNG